MKKQTPKAKRLTESKAKHLKTVKRRQLSEIKKSIGKYLNEGEARAAHLKTQQDRYGSDAKWGKMVPPPGYSDGKMRIPNFQSLDDLNRTLISFELEPIDIQDHNESFGLNHTEGTFVGQVNAYFAYGRLGLEVNNLIDSIYYPDEETKTNAFADPEDQIDDRIALQNFSKKSHAQQYDHPLNEVKNSLKKSIRKYQRLNENEGEISVNINREEDEVEVTYKGESYKSALGDELLFIHYFEDDEYHSENDAPEIFKYLKGKGGELEVDDKEATLTINMSNLKSK